LAIWRSLESPSTLVQPFTGKRVYDKGSVLLAHSPGVCTDTWMMLLTPLATLLAVDTRVTQLLKECGTIEQGQALLCWLVAQMGVSRLFISGSC